MSTELTTQDNSTTYSPEMPQNGQMDFSDISQGTVAIESSRAIAEAQGKLVIAKKFPRNETRAYTRVIEACRRPKFAEKAFYSFPRGKEQVQGPSIRFAEEIARCWGNVDYGIKELSQEDGKSEMQAFAWDLETNTRSEQNFTVPHIRNAYGKAVKLTAQRDIYENNTNMASRRLRARLLAILPSDLVDSAVDECKNTVKNGGGKSLPDLVKDMVVKFSKLGVPLEMIERRLGKTCDTMTGEEYADYVGIYTSLKDKNTRISDWFDNGKEATDLTNAALDAIEQQKL